MNPKQHDEVQKLLVELYDLTGYKMTADDPTIAMMLIQRREMAALIQQHQAQQQTFLSNFAQSSEQIIQSAAELQTQKEQVIAEILQTNAKERSELEQKLFASISQKVQKQYQVQTSVLIQSLKTNMMIWVAIQVIIFVVAIIFLKK